MALLTLAEYKSLTGTTGTTNDTFISSLLPSVQSQIETYCDRKFDRAVNYEWLQYDESLALDQWPVNNILMIGTAIVVATVADSTSSYTLNIERGKNAQDGISGLYVTNQYTLASTFYSFATYLTLGALKTAVEAGSVGVTITLSTSPTYSYSDMSTQLLRDCTGGYIYGAYNQAAVQYRIEEGTRRYLAIPANITTIFQTLDYWFETTLFIAYNYGYDTANVPQDLKLAVANIIKDTINISNSSGGGLYKSETITNYSYTLQDNGQIGKLINDRYVLQLEPYRRKGIF